MPRLHSRGPGPSRRPPSRSVGGCAVRDRTRQQPPLDALLAAAAKAADDADVRRWLTRLLRSGESAGSDTATADAPQRRPGRKAVAG